MLRCSCDWRNLCPASLCRITVSMCTYCAASSFFSCEVFKPLACRARRTCERKTSPGMSGKYVQLFHVLILIVFLPSEQQNVGLGR